MVGGKKRSRGAAGDAGLELLPGAHAAARPVDDLAQRGAHGEFEADAVLRTCPLMQKSLVPAASGMRASPRNQAAPLATMAGMLASVSTLFTTVGPPQSPFTAGKGGFARGLGRFPSRAFISAVSSPQI